MVDRRGLVQTWVFLRQEAISEDASYILNDGLEGSVWGAFAGSTESMGRVGHALGGTTAGMCKTAGRAQARSWLLVTPKLYPIPHVSESQPETWCGARGVW
jgi:hypothetical protein